jgi:hypothetical protein
MALCVPFVSLRVTKKELTQSHTETHRDSQRILLILTPVKGYENGHISF